MKIILQSIKLCWDKRHKEWDTKIPNIFYTYSGRYSDFDNYYWNNVSRTFYFLYWGFLTIEYRIFKK